MLSRTAAAAVGSEGTSLGLCAVRVGAAKGHVLSGEAPLTWPVDDGPCDTLPVQKQKAQWFVTGYTEDSCD